MFPLRCARVRAHTGREISAHENTWSAQKFSAGEGAREAHPAYI